ncbi:MAG: hypothetical protein RI914_213 [Pseudomonadota bacterium]|jgi:hypothetical protein
MQVMKRWAMALGLITAVLATTGCGTISTITKLEDGAGTEAMRMWDRWVEAEGDIAVATTWEAKVKDGITVADIEEIFRQVAAEHNIRDVGTLPLSKELEARSGKKEPLLTIYQFCSPVIARNMTDFSPHMAAYMPCRVSLVERSDGIWLYTLNMDMMVKMGRKLPSPLKEQAWQVREAMWALLNRAANGEF